LYKSHAGSLCHGQKKERPGAGLSPTSFSVHLPATVPTGPASLVVINKGSDGSYAKSSNAVSVVVVPTINKTSVSQNASTITVNGTGFSTLTVINFFNTQAGKEVNLGGLKTSGGARIPLAVVNSTKFTFSLASRPGSVAGSSRPSAQSAIRTVHQFRQRSGRRVHAEVMVRVAAANHN